MYHDKTLKTNFLNIFLVYFVEYLDTNNKQEEKIGKE